MILGPHFWGNIHRRLASSFSSERKLIPMSLRGLIMMIFAYESNFYFVTAFVFLQNSTFFPLVSYTTCNRGTVWGISFWQYWRNEIVLCGTSDMARPSFTLDKRSWSGLCGKPRLADCCPVYTSYPDIPPALEPLQQHGSMAPAWDSTHPRHLAF